MYSSHRKVFIPIPRIHLRLVGHPEVIQRRTLRENVLGEPVTLAIKLRVARQRDSTQRPEAVGEISARLFHGFHK